MGLSKSIGINANKNLGQTSRNLTRATEELMTGRKSPTKHVVSVLKGLQNQSTAKVLEAVAESAKYGSTLLNVASSSLYELLDGLTELRETIAQAETADANITANLNAFYRAKVDAITDILNNANFAGRQLFDGSMTNPANPIVYGGLDKTVPIEGILPTASALSIRVGESFNNNVQVSIPRLLPGLNFNNPDISVAGRFTPIFPINQFAVDLKNAAVNVLDTVINALQGHDTGKNTNAQQARDNVYNLPDPATYTAIQKSILTAAKTAADSANSNVLATADLEGANYIRNQTFYAMLGAAAPYISVEAIAVFKSILDVEKTYPMNNNSSQQDYKNAIKTIPLPGNIIGDDIINYIQDDTKVPIDGAPSTATFFDRQKYVTFTLITNVTINANPVNALGNLLTRTDRAAADATIVTAMGTVNSVISSLNGQQSILDGAIDGLNNSIAANKEAANDLLSANIVEAANEVKSILALIQSVYFVLGNIDQINQLNAILLRA